MWSPWIFLSRRWGGPNPSPPKKRGGGPLPHHHHLSQFHNQRNSWGFLSQKSVSHFRKTISPYMHEAKYGLRRENSSHILYFLKLFWKTREVREQPQATYLVHYGFRQARWIMITLGLITSFSVHPPRCALSQRCGPHGKAQGQLTF